MIVVAPNRVSKAGWLEEIGEKHGFQFDVHIWRVDKESSPPLTFSTEIATRSRQS